MHRVWERWFNHWVRHGGERPELERLLQQCRELREEASFLLDQLQLQPGWRVIDLGCGPLGILDLLAERVGLSGEVVDLEREACFVDMARAELDRRGLSHVRLVNGGCHGFRSKWAHGVLY